MMHQSKPGVRRRRLSQPSIHLPRSVYLPSIKIGSLARSRFSFGAKKSSLATSTAPPTFSEARSIKSVKFIATKRHKMHESGQGYFFISNRGAPKLMSSPCSMRAARKYPKSWPCVLQLKSHNPFISQRSEEHTSELQSH